jgi:hypothetical protein
MFALGCLLMTIGLIKLAPSHPSRSPTARHKVQPDNYRKALHSAGLRAEDDDEEEEEDEDEEEIIEDDGEEEEEDEPQPVITKNTGARRKWDKLAFYLQSDEINNIGAIKSSASELALLDTPDNVHSFIMGYLRAHLACEEAANRRDWVVSPQVMEQMPFENPLYLSTNTRFGPYFCLNFPIECYLVTAQDLVAQTALATMAAAQPRQPYYALQHLQDTSGGGEEDEEEEDEEQGNVLTSAQIQVQRWAETWMKQLAAFDGGVERSVSPSAAFARSSIHTAEMLGYQRDGFLVRNLLGLGHAQQPVAGFDIVNYTSLVDIARQLAQALVESMENGLSPAEAPRAWKKATSASAPGLEASAAGTSLCLCGPHLGIARHLVVYINVNTINHNHARTVIYVEPIIVSSNAARNSASPAPPPLSPPVAGKGKKRKAAATSDESLFSWVAPPTPLASLSASVGAAAPLPTNTRASAIKKAAAHQQRFALYQRYLRTDEQLRKHLPSLELLGYSKELLATEITVDHFELFATEVTIEVPSPRTQRSGGGGGGNAQRHTAPRTATTTIHVLDNYRRAIVPSKGQEAYCLQYCQTMAYALADAMSNETLVKSTVDLIIPPLVEPTTTKKTATKSAPPSSKQKKSTSQPRRRM